MKKPIPSFNCQIAVAQKHWADLQEEVRVEKEEEVEQEHYRPWDWWEDDYSEEWYNGRSTY